MMTRTSARANAGVTLVVAASLAAVSEAILIVEQSVIYPSID